MTKIECQAIALALSNAKTEIMMLPAYFSLSNAERALINTQWEKDVNAMANVCSKYCPEFDLPTFKELSGFRK